MLGGLSLKIKLILAFTTIAMGLLVVGGIGYYSIHDVTSKYSHVVKVNLAKSIALGEMRDSSRWIRSQMNHLGIPNTSNEELDEAKTKFEKTVKNFEKNEETYTSLPFADSEKLIYDAQNEHWKKFTLVAERLIALASTKKPADRVKFLAVLATQLRQRSDEHTKALAKLIEFQDDEAMKWSNSSEQSARTGTRLMVLAIVIGFMLALSIAFVFANTLTTSLGHLAENLGVGADEVASASNQISASSSELSSSATEQAAALQETAASVDQISAMINKNADNAKKSQEFSIRSRDAATQGRETVVEMRQSIEEISKSNFQIMTQMETSNREISEIVKVISEIGNKTKVINDIVFQTKLLSFNASVEAARAGEHGKGFAVVAEEVGNLAQMSGNAAKEITQMLDGSIQKVERIVTDTKSKIEHLVESGKEKVNVGTTIAQRCGEVLDKIVTEVSEVNQMINEIAAASYEQSQGVQEITKAMAQLDQVTQQNASASQESSNAAVLLTTQAEELRNMVRSLMMTVRGANTLTRMTSVQLGSSSEKSKVASNKPGSSSKNKKSKHNLNYSSSNQNSSSSTKKTGSESLPSEDDPRFENG